MPKITADGDVNTCPTLSAFTLLKLILRSTFLPLSCFDYTVRSSRNPTFWTPLRFPSFKIGAIAVACICGVISEGTGNNNNKAPDMSRVDVYGNALACTCADGYIPQSTTCPTGALRSGSCSGVSSARAGSLLQLARRIFAISYGFTRGWTAFLRNSFGLSHVVLQIIPWILMAQQIYISKLVINYECMWRLYCCPIFSPYHNPKCRVHTSHRYNHKLHRYQNLEDKTTSIHCTRIMRVYPTFRLHVHPLHGHIRSGVLGWFILRTLRQQHRGGQLRGHGVLMSCR